jgi:hypothetical protein
LIFASSASPTTVAYPYSSPVFVINAIAFTPNPEQRADLEELDTVKLNTMKPLRHSEAA